ncbi:MAG: DNA repair protein RadC [Clostridiales bacterium]|nr:DNA repair protein RadC [Clostridiales bacterium]
MQDYLGHRQRLRERFDKTGLDGFAPYEALELLLCYAIPRRDVKPIAKALLARFGSISRVLSASKEDLCEVSGIGPSAASLITLMLPLMRLYGKDQAEQTLRLGSLKGRLDYCRAMLVGETYEHLYVLALDAKDSLLLKTLISRGDEGETAVYPRLIVAALLRAGAKGAILCHNHPDGDAEPSRADIAMTGALQALLAPLGIVLRDHVIVTNNAYYSFAQNRLID